MAITKPKLLTMKVSTDEKQRWSEIATANGISLAELIRRRLDGDTTKPKPKSKSVDKDLLFQIAAIGNNLNQIARRLNGGESFEVLVALQKIESNLQRVLDAHKIS